MLVLIKDEEELLNLILKKTVISVMMVQLIYIIIHTERTALIWEHF